MSIVVVLVDVRSTYNVGAILRTAECFGIREVLAVGLTPYISDDERPPHIRLRHKRAITKSALGAEACVSMRHLETFPEAISLLRRQNYYVIALEQHAASVPINHALSVKSKKIAIVVGCETTGLNPTQLAQCDEIREIAMYGRKESLNVSVAFGIAAYALKSTTVNP